jgi:predicted NUDIX family NTP pyrophosphohydrolase
MPTNSISKNQSAGLLLYRRSGKDLEILLGHPGGPFWKNKDEGAWGIPKGAIGKGELQLAAAKREFKEETGFCPRGEFVPLGHAKQPGGKIVHVWAVEGDCDASGLQSNNFEIEWPPRCGRKQLFPEIDRASWFKISDAREKILKGQAVFIDRLLEAVD